MRRLGFFLCVLVVVTTTTLLVNGSDLLGYALINEPYVPLGNVLTWLAVIALPLSLYLGIRRFRLPRSKVDHILKVLVLITIVLGLIWYPVSWPWQIISREVSEGMELSEEVLVPESTTGFIHTQLWDFRYFFGSFISYCDFSENKPITKQQDSKNHVKVL